MPFITAKQINPGAISCSMISGLSATRKRNCSSGVSPGIFSMIVVSLMPPPI
jgi:hypothetical protein